MNVINAWRRPRLAAVAVAMLGVLVGAQEPARPAEDADFAAQVRQWTTAPEFSSPLVDHLPLLPGVPTPKDVLGYHVGAPGKLTHTADLYRYFRALEAASPRVKVHTIGKTDEGRDILVVFVSAEAAIRDLDAYRARLASLADPRQLTDAAAAEVIGQAKPIYVLTGGLHSAETGPPEMLMELAYRLAVEDTPLIRTIRDNVIVGIVPVLGARRARSLRGLVRQAPRRRSPTSATASAARPTGASTSSTTTTGTSTTRR